MSGVTIGVHLHADPAGLRRTLSALHANTTPHHTVLVLSGTDDEESAGALARLEEQPPPGAATRAICDAALVGGAAALNRLAAESNTDVVVLLESGAVPGPRWLDELLGALASSPRAGLAGPTTNRSWNDQGAYPGQLEATDEEIAGTAAEVHRLHQGKFVLLAPLYSLADFCYAVRRDVLQAIGPADEGYGPGPCWEMDLNARAMRAGFDGLWARGSYVWRAPFTRRRAETERALMDASRERYQERFCGARLRGEKTDFRRHCRGDACANFAPVPHRASVVYSEPPRAPDAPLVSCIMPTLNRLPFVKLALECFRRQLYPAKELIIVDDGTEGLEELVAGHSQVRYVRTSRRLTIGTKRNIACQAAAGEFIVHWDDDDWYGPRRLQLQVEPLLRGDADITGMQNEFVLELESRRFWTTDARVHRTMFVGDVHGGTIAYRRSHWAAGLRYPDSNLGEDAYLLRVAARRKLRLRRVSNEGEFVYMRHGTNTWRFVPGTFVDPAGWRETSAPHTFGADALDAYHSALMALRS
ncbi:MAG: glycosyl transferase family 2 [Gemmatimonadetes bacterium]|nr:glycosyl transferase family 2 [Gemmatimonadota bacterium]